MKTYVATPENRERDWLVVDATGQTLGRLATQIADALRGKHKPEYTPHCDVGDFVVVVNAEKIAVTGNKREEKLYYRHSGYPGGLRTRTLEEMLERRPEEVIRLAVKGMLPRNRLARAAAAQAQGLRRPRPSARRAAAQADGDRELMADEPQDTPQDEPAPERAGGRASPPPRSPRRRPRQPDGRRVRGRGAR